MKKYIYIVLLAGMFSLKAYTQGSWYDQANERIDTLRKGNFSVKILDRESNPVTDTIYVRLKKHEFQFGVTMPMPGVTPDFMWAQATATKYYNYGVFGRFKWHNMEPSEGVISYDLTDTIIKWSEKAGWDFRAHTLLWGGPEDWQMPSWTLDPALTAEEVYNACKTRIKRDVAHYKGIINEYDVMNEPANTTWLSDKVGDSIHWNSFKWAREADSSAALYVNEYNIMVWGSMPDYKAVIDEMLDNGAPIDGIGLQGHMEGNINVAQVKARIDTMAKYGLPVKITEFDMKVDNFDLSEQQQANEYLKMYRIAFSHPAVESIIQWDFCDSWSYNAGAGIISENKIPKIAADSLYHLLHEQWTTEISDTTDTEGILTFKGFYGDYEVIATVNDTSRIFYIPAYKAFEDSAFTLSMVEGLPVPPELTEVGLSYDGTEAEITFDKDIDSTTLEKDFFHVYSMANNQVTDIRMKEGDMKTIVLTLKYPIVHRQIGAVIYCWGNVMSADSGRMKDFGPEYIINKIPGYSMAITNNEGTAVELTFTEEMEEDIPVDNFSISVNSTGCNIDTAYFKEGDNYTIVFELADKVIIGGDLVFIFYEPGIYKSAEGYLLGQFGPKYVLNSLTTSSDDHQNDSYSITIYPNPFNDNLHFSNLREIDKIEIFNTMGQLMDTYNVSGHNELEINTSRMEKSIYIVRFIDNSGNVNTKKITKN